MTAVRKRTRCPLNSTRKQARKRTLAERDGSWCAYCGRLFADLRHATIDHVAPFSLYRTWRMEHTVLACGPCNQDKADRLPLLLALLILDRHGHLAPDPSPDADADESPDSDTYRPVFTPDVWALLARIAGAVESGTWPDQAAGRSPDTSGHESMPDQGGRHLVPGVPTVPVGTGCARLVPRTPTDPSAIVEAA